MELLIQRLCFCCSIIIMMQQILFLVGASPKNGFVVRAFQTPKFTLSSQRWMNMRTSMITRIDNILTVQTQRTTTSCLFFSSSSSSSSASAAGVSTHSSSSAAVPTTEFEWITLETIQNTMVHVLNEIYDPKQVARGIAIAKLSSSSKKKKNQQKEDNNPENEPNQQGDDELMKDEVIAEAVARAPEEFGISDAGVTMATKTDFGDYQVNAALQLAKGLSKANPRECAQEIIQTLFEKHPHIAKQLETPEIAGPGFINLKFQSEYLERAILAMASDPQRLGIPNTNHPQKIVVDYSSPNIAKEMHVGHLRSTIIGDTLCNVLEFVGHTVQRLNHVGDWGTQFGMLVEHLRDEYPQILSVKNNDDDDTTETATTKKNLDLGDLVEFYKAAKKRFDADEDFKQRARNAVVRLQSRQDPTAVAAWEALCAASRVEYKSIYNTLNIDDRLIERGESFYNPYLPEIVQDLESKGYAVESDGALAVFVDGYANRDGTPFPLIVRKSDGGYNYATTDLAAIRHRCFQMESDGGELADRVLYVTDAGQAQHFDMVFAVARKAGFVPEHVSLEHVPFGLVQGEDGKKFATRSGETVKLKDLLNEAVRIAGKDLRERAQDTDDPAFIARAEKVAQIVGIGAVKYADLSMNRESNYRFSYERMLSLNGNTAPYMLYAYARLCGIIRKATGQAEPNSTDGMAIVAVEWPLPASKIILSHDSEIELARALVKLPDVISEVEHNLYPNRMCDYLYDVSVKFNQFYENCSVKNAETPDLRASRLSLCTATAGVMRLLMTLLGLEVVEKL